MSTLLELVKDSLDALGHENSFSVALSGGVDSVSLLHILYHIKIQYYPHLKLSAIHINHGISSNADAWQQFCIGLCNSYNIPIECYVTRVTRHGGESLENNARIARYQYFEQINANVIVLAHHRNDQIETMLSQIFRGSDLHNVGGMKQYSSFNTKMLWRPLLNTMRLAIQSYATLHNLSFVYDQSNSNKLYLRNFVRHDILPDLIAYDANVVSKLINFIDNVQDALSLIDEITACDYEMVCCVDVKLNRVLSVYKISTLSSKRQLNVIIYYLKEHNLPFPAKRRILEFLRQVFTAKIDKKPKLDINQTCFLMRKSGNICINT